jgi:hypothetical protein
MMKIPRIVLTIFMVIAAWLTLQGYLPWIFGWIIVFGDAILVVMIEIRANLDDKRCNELNPSE